MRMNDFSVGLSKEGLGTQKSNLLLNRWARFAKSNQNINYCQDILGFNSKYKLEKVDDEKILQHKTKSILLKLSHI